jgi:histidyl-tRNA synthetase
VAKNEIINIKGATDITPFEMYERNRVIEILRKKFEGYGYLPLETASVNYLSLLTHKYDQNAEIVHEIYKIRDQGDRDLGLRFDLTVPFCKYIAMNQNLKMPFKRYEIGKVWRNGPVKSGRTREFYQCDIDAVGIEGTAIEAELISLAIAAFLEIGITPIVKYGNRKLLPYPDSVISIIDKMAKVQPAEIIAELSKHMSKTDAEKLIIDVKNTPKNTEIVELERHLSELEVLKYCEYAPYLARGLNIYTGTVWEIFTRDVPFQSSLGGGGRYDKIIGNFIDNGKNYPAVGTSFGLEPICAVLREMRGKSTANQSSAVPISQNGFASHFADLMLIPINTEAWCQKYANELRAKGQNVLVYLGGKKLGAAFEYAAAYGIKNVAVIGEDEVRGKQIVIKKIN